MSANAIICEYNPFHNGHKYQINHIKSVSESPIVAIMSGSFTQRGDVALIDKFKRARLAIKGGVDLVLELPTVFATASAQEFARAGVETAKALGCVDKLCFGAEDKPEVIFKAAHAFEIEEFNNSLKEFMNQGCYYPQAVEKAMDRVCPSYVVEAVKKPNNILAVEYIKALKGCGFGILVTERRGAEHDGDKTADGFASAGKIRELANSGKDFSEFVPDFNAADYECIADIGRLEKVILYKLRTMTPEDFRRLSGVSEGLENRLFRIAQSASSLDEIFEGAKTKRYTLARLRRIIIAALLGIDEKTVKSRVPYIRVLAFNEKGAKLLGEIKKTCSLPLITNVAASYKALDKNAQRIFDFDILATNLYSLATEKVKPCGSDFTVPIQVFNSETE